MFPQVATVGVPTVDGFTCVLHKPCDGRKEGQDGDGDKMVQLVNAVIVADLGTQGQTSDAVDGSVQPVK